MSEGKVEFKKRTLEDVNNDYSAAVFSLGQAVEIRDFRLPRQIKDLTARIDATWLQIEKFHAEHGVISKQIELDKANDFLKKNAEQKQEAFLGVVKEGASQ